MIAKNTAQAYPENKTSSNTRTLEDVKKDMAWQEQIIQNLREDIEDYDTGWADGFEDNPRKRARMEQRLKAEEDRYAQLTKELESYPDYYAEKYKDAGGFEKALTGIVGSTIATVPVIAETTSAALKEAEEKGMAEDYTAALQAEEIARNKMNDYVSSYFGFYDMIDQDEVDRLTQEYQRASEYSDSMARKYEEPVNMDSWGMNLMRESAWLKNSATENLDGLGKTIADIAIDVGQDVALSPLLLAGGGAYTAGVAANAAAEDMYKQSAAGKAASEALGSGILTAGSNAAGWVISKKLPKEAILNLGPDEKISASVLLREIRMNGKEFTKKLAERVGLETTEETVKFILDFLVDKVAGDPAAKISLREFAKSAAANKSSDLAEKSAETFWDLLEAAWKAMGE